MVSWVGYRQEAIFYDRQARFAGETKYPLRKLVALAVNGVTYRGYVFRELPYGPVALSLLLGLVLGSLMSVAAAVGPALFAARKEPVEAMRVEE
jgi:dolichol-phosphate mannosyltransferase